MTQSGPSGPLCSLNTLTGDQLQKSLKRWAGFLPSSGIDQGKAYTAYDAVLTGLALMLTEFNQVEIPSTLTP